MSQSALNESLARLDAALGVSPGRTKPRTIVPKGHSTLSAVNNISHILDGKGLDNSLAIESPYANLSALGDSFLGNESFFDNEVTAAVPHYTDNNLDVSQLPAQQNAQVLFSEFVQVLVGEGGPKGVEDGVWGECQQYELLCDQQRKHILRIIRRMPKHHSNTKKIEKVLEQVTSECNMWRLLRCLYKDRISIEDTECSFSNAHLMSSDQTIIGELFDSCREVREGQIVVDWLERSASEALTDMHEKMEHYGDSHIAWENTLKIVKANNRNKGQGVGRLMIGGVNESSQLISSLDPDAPVREGKALADIDQEDERVLIRRIMMSIRSGGMQEAQEMCVGSGQHWRAATMEGWKLHHDPNVTDSSARSPVIGNPYRDLWKSVAWNASEDSRLPYHERAVYGAQCGNLKAILLVCEKWEDLLWANLKVMVDQWVEEALRIIHNHMKIRTLHPLPKNYPEQRLSFTSIFTNIEKSCTNEELVNPYFLLCKFLILDDMSGLMSCVKNWLNTSLSPHLLRCITHLLLVLRKCSIIVEIEHIDVVNDVIHACVKCAMERGDVEQIAWYTAMLPSDQQVACYASFLTNINDPPQRLHALTLANTVGLDTESLAATTLAIIRLTPTGTDMDSDVGTTTQHDRVKISALDWVLFDDALKQDALIQGLSMVRTFLIARKNSAATMVIDKLPQDIISSLSNDNNSVIECAVREYLCIKTYLAAQESFSDWFDHFHQQKPSPPEGIASSSGNTFSDQIAMDHSRLLYENSLSKWQTALDRLTKMATDRLYNVLLFPDGGWLVDPPSLPHMDQSSNGSERLKYLKSELAAREPHRLRQLKTLRNICIPQVCSLLQNILQSTKQQKECLQLADIVSSELHQLYTAFGSQDMQRFLMKMVESSKSLLDDEKDALGYPLH